jgi:hypothetical protein
MVREGVNLDCLVKRKVVVRYILHSWVTSFPLGASGSLVGAGKILHRNECYFLDQNQR